jgi:hypothetical protein
MTNRKIERINDDQLAAQLNAVRAHIRRTRKHGGDTLEAEIELCYLEREEEHRQNAIIAHEIYKKKVQEEWELLAKEEEEAINEFLEGQSQLFYE